MSSTAIGNYPMGGFEEPYQSIPRDEEKVYHCLIEYEKQDGEMITTFEDVSIEVSQDATERDIKQEIEESLERTYQGSVEILDYYEIFS